ncbi:hypothetical protein KEM54_002081 [Ascosphaera aggregata]|nr:hypothetical protein KEM54_002081 [Ascosphaera aggregata]
MPTYNGYMNKAALNFIINQPDDDDEEAATDPLMSILCPSAIEEHKHKHEQKQQAAAAKRDHIRAQQDSAKTHSQLQSLPLRPMDPVLRKRSANNVTTIQSPAKKQSKWSAREDALIIEYRNKNMKWKEISREIPGRSATSCRLHYQNYLEKRCVWNEDRKNKLARLYERFKKSIWSEIAAEMDIPWRAAEAMHWQLGAKEMAERAGVPQFNFVAQPTDQETVAVPSCTKPSRQTIDIGISHLTGFPSPSSSEFSLNDFDSGS